MSNISSIIEVFRMQEITPLTRGKILIKLGFAINHEMCGNITERLINELLIALNLDKSSCKEVKEYIEHLETMKIREVEEQQAHEQ